MGLDDHMTFSIPIQPDETGMTGRECPQSECLGYFKVKSGTGLTGGDLSCTCPYCGHTGDPNTFWTQEQIAYAQLIAIREVTERLVQELKKSEFRIRPKGPFDIGLSMRVEAGTPTPVHHYREKQLETEVICNTCALHYAIYGVFGFCPDCGIHNSLQILHSNLELAGKELDLAAVAESKELRQYLVCDALKNAVSSLDGFGREFVSRHAQRSGNPQQVSKLSFQNLSAANEKLEKLFGISLSKFVADEEWKKITRSFQKRHLLTHKMGVIDAQYITQTGDATAVLGRRIAVTPEEAREAIRIVHQLGNSLASSF